MIHDIQKRKYFLSILAYLIVPISGLAVDIYVPSLPAVSHYFGVEKSLVQLTVTAYMIGIGGMQLFAGSISDSFGRRNPFIIAMPIFIVATLLVPWSRTINDLLFLRFLQGITAALTVVPMRSVIADLFEGRELYKMMNYMTMAWSIGPIIAPAMGGYLQHYFGWKSNFYFLAIYSSLVFMLTFIYLPETSQYRHRFHLGGIIIRYKKILFHKEYAAGLIINGALYSLITLFGIVGPFLIQTVLQYTPVVFGHISLLLGLSWFLGTMTNRFLLDISLDMKSKICFFSMLALTLIMLFLSLVFPLNIYNIVIPIFISLWLGGIVFPNYFARNLAFFPEMTASANALFSGIVFLISGLTTGLGTFLKSTSEMPLASAYIGLISICLIIYYLSTPKITKVDDLNLMRMQ